MTAIPPICCPACLGEVTAKARRDYSAREAADYFCPPSRSPMRNERLLSAIESGWPDKLASIRVCEHCGFGFAWPHRGGNDDFYHTLHEQAGYPTWRWDYDQALASAGLGETHGKVLDIGAGAGIFLSKLPPGWSAHAVESSAITRQLLTDQGIKTYAGIPEAMAEGPFDFVTLFQVLEHIAPFEEFIEASVTALAPGGTIFITVPLGPMMTEQETRIGCPDMPPNHVNRWTPASLANVLQRHGLIPGEPVIEPDNLKLLRARLHLIIMNSAAKRPRSLASLIYRVQRRAIRIPLFALLAGGLALGHITHLKWMTRGGAFALGAIKPPSNSPP